MSYCNHALVGLLLSLLSGLVIPTIPQNSTSVFASLTFRTYSEVSLCWSRHMWDHVL